MMGYAIEANSPCHNIALRVLQDLGTDTHPDRVALLAGIVDDELRKGFSAAEHDVLSERVRQVRDEGFDAAHDDRHDRKEIAMAAAAYAIADIHMLQVRLWPWRTEEWKPRDRRSNLVRSGALAIAEIQRIDRRTNALRAELAELEADNAAATGWGAAVGARSERIHNLRRDLGMAGDAA